MKISFHFVFNKPIFSVRCGYGSTLFVDAERVATAPHQLPPKLPEKVTISFVDCGWTIWQGDALIADNTTDPEVIKDFVPELMGLKIEEVKYLPKTKNWLFQLDDGTQLYAEFESDLQKCLIEDGERSYMLWGDGDVSKNEK